MSKHNVRDLLVSYLPNLKADIDLLKKLEKFKIDWGNKDDNYIEFLGSTLLGVFPIRFSTKDEDLLMVDILNVDKNELQSDLYNTPGVNRNFKISSNCINITLLYLIHLFSESKTLSSKDKSKAMNTLYHIFAYKQIGSLYSHYFPYDVDRNLAQSVLETLPNKFLIKRLGSWEALFDHQCELLLPPKGANTRRIKEFTDDDILRSINDMQGRIRSTVKNLTSVLYSFIEKNGSRLSTTSLIQKDEENGDGIRDSLDSYSSQVDFIKSIIFSPNDFVNNDYIYVIGSFVPTCKTSKLTDVLNYISFNNKHHNDVMFIVETSIKEGLAYLRTKGITSNYVNNVRRVLVELKGYYSASKVKSEDLLKAKELGYKIVSEAIHSKTKWIVVPIVIAMMMYIFLRSINR